MSDHRPEFREYLDINGTSQFGVLCSCGWMAAGYNKLGAQQAFDNHFAFHVTGEKFHA